MADKADDDTLKGKQVRNIVVYYIKCCVIRYSSMCNLIVSYLKTHYDYDLAHKYEGYGKIRSDWCSNFDATVHDFMSREVEMQELPPVHQS